MLQNTAFDLYISLCPCSSVGGPIDYNNYQAVFLTWQQSCNNTATLNIKIQLKFKFTKLISIDFIE